MLDPPIIAVRQAVQRALEEDWLPLGDLAGALIEPSRMARMEIVSREQGVLAGRLCALETFAAVDPGIHVEWSCEDGATLDAGTVVAQVSGSLRSIVGAERTALNFMCHLSGIATQTHRVVEAVRAVNPSTRVLDTRKTLPGLRALQKAAVRAGGGTNHRGSLSDAVLLKDNHLGALPIAEAVANAKRQWPGRMVEVECDDGAQAVQAAQAGADVVMLDNMAPEEVAAAISNLRARGITTMVEVSGGVTLDSAAAYAAAGASLVSMGALTHSSPALDLGLDMVDAWTPQH